MKLATVNSGNWKGWDVVGNRSVQEEVKMSLEDAIRVIQIHERARQGRLRAKFMREIRQQEEREKRAAARGAPTLDPEVASVRIQKVRVIKHRTTTPATSGHNSG